MKIDVREFGLQVIRGLNELIDQIQIPDDVFREVGMSGFKVVLFESGGAHHKEKLQSAIKDFERLCSSTFAPPDSVKIISISYAALSMLFEEGSEWPGDVDALKTIMVAQHASGVALGILSGTALALTQKKVELSKAGRKGADTRNKPYELLRGWALEKASEMRGADRDIARKLAPLVPAYLADASKDPMRLIYDALRTKPRNLT